jgi:2,3-bisphosphoglycerate-dependent phosphoglycerate mutase
MKIIIVLFTLIFFAAPLCHAQKKITTFVLLRHAEKGNDDPKDPELKPEGMERAIRLTKMLAKTSVDAIYSTAFKRTRNTVAPLAAVKGLEVQTYEAHKTDEIENMLQKYAGGTIVICGHSNTIPRMANVLIGKEAFKDYDDSDYDNFLIISVVEKGKVAKVTWLSY